MFALFTPQRRALVLEDAIVSHFGSMNLAGSDGHSRGANIRTCPGESATAHRWHHPLETWNVEGKGRTSEQNLD